MKNATFLTALLILAFGASAQTTSSARPNAIPPNAQRTRANAGGVTSTGTPQSAKSAEVGGVSVSPTVIKTPPTVIPPVVRK